MSNTLPWRKKLRTEKPNSRQKRNGIFLDNHPICQLCQAKAAKEAHHVLPKGHAQRNLWQFMRALCPPCHIEEHRPEA